MHFKGMEKVADLIVINLLFILCSLPVITVGASATAMHYALRRWREGQGSITKDFFKSFRLNFRQATVLWLVFLLLAGVLALNFWMVSSWTGSMYQVAMVLLIVVSAVLLAWAGVVFPFLARFDNSTIQIAKNALLIALVSPGKSLAVMVMNILPVALAVVLPGIFLILSVLWLGLLCSACGHGVQLLFSPVFDRIGQSDS